MNRILMIASIIHFWFSFGQEKPVFKPLRYEDDFSYLNSSSKRNWYGKLKFTPFNNAGTVYLSMGGDIRYQYYITKNEDWGDTEKDKNGYILSRYLAHIDFHASKYFRVFYQLQNSNSVGRVNPSPVENNLWDTHQLFFDLKVPLQKNTNLTIRAGRQELSYGSQRLISVRENPNSRLTFDGVKAMLTAADLKSDLFYMHPVGIIQGSFNDSYNKDIQFWGSYNTLNKIPVLKNIDFYYLGLWKLQGKYDVITGEEIRHSIGTRIWNTKGSWFYDIEGLYQFGEVGNQNINAWTLSVNSSYKFKDIKFSPTFSMKIDLISGNLDYDDTLLETFNPLFPKGAYFGWAGYIGPSNLIDIHPGADFQISHKLNITFDYDIFWRYSKNDGLYAPNFQLIYSGQNSSEKFIGTQLSNQIIYQLSNHFLFKLETVWFNAGNFIKDTGAGKDILSGAITAQFKF